jgi:putative sigma-54 modulation protein
MVTFRHVEPTDGLRQHAEDKIQRMRKFLRRPIEAHVTLSVIKHRHVAEVQLSADHLNLTATEETGDLYSAIDLATTKLERQIKKHVAKNKEHKGGDSASVKAGTASAGEGQGRVIRAQRVAVKPMSVDEAVTQLRMQKSDFLLFKNAANETLSVIYRRKDGNYGLIVPEPS